MYTLAWRLNNSYMYPYRVNNEPLNLLRRYLQNDKKLDVASHCKMSCVFQECFDIMNTDADLRSHEGKAMPLFYGLLEGFITFVC